MATDKVPRLVACMHGERMHAMMRTVPAGIYGNVDRGCISGMQSMIKKQSQQAEILGVHEAHSEQGL